MLKKTEWAIPIFVVLLLSILALANYIKLISNEPKPLSETQILSDKMKVEHQMIMARLDSPGERERMVERSLNSLAHKIPLIPGAVYAPKAKN